MTPSEKTQAVYRVRHQRRKMARLERALRALLLRAVRFPDLFVQLQQLRAELWYLQFSAKILNLEHRNNP